MITIKAHVMKKVPVPGKEYSSQEYSAEVQVELPGESMDTLSEKVNALYAQIEGVIDARLGMKGAPPEQKAPSSSTKGFPPRFRVTSGGNGNGKKHRTGATQSQVKAIFAISKAIRMDKGTLEGHLLESYGVGKPQDLSIRQASEVIEELDRIQKSAQ